MNVKYLLFFLLMGGMISCQSSDEYSEETQEPEKEQEEESACQAWQDFVSRSERNVLLDFHTPDTNVEKWLRRIFGL